MYDIYRNGFLWWDVKIAIEKAALSTSTVVSDLFQLYIDACILQLHNAEVTNDWVDPVTGGPLLANIFEYSDNGMWNGTTCVCQTV